MMGILGKWDDINKQTGSTEKAKLEVRNSIVGMMDLLANLESKELNTGVGKTNAKTKKNQKLRSSVAGMMDLLANLENTTTTSDKPKQGNRKSVVDMMSTLSAARTTCN